MQLHPAAAGQGVRLAVYQTVGSTNSEALLRAAAGETGPLWIVAERQTAGRGRRGRTWVSEAGNLYASLLLIDPSPSDRAAELSMVAALALRDAIVEIAPSLAPRLNFKWPNDLLLDGRKTAGILVEGEMSALRLAVAIGIGVNCAHHPDLASYPATSLAEAGVAIEPAPLFRAISAALPTRLSQWDEGRGFPAVRAEWLRAAAGLGHKIRVHLGDDEVAGCFENMDEKGRMMLRLPNGRLETIAAGDVFPPATAVIAFAGDRR